jgi:hypothetical protein
MRKDKTPTYEVFEAESKYGPDHGRGFGIRRLPDGEIIRHPRNPNERSTVEEQCRILNARFAPKGA